MCNANVIITRELFERYPMPANATSSEFISHYWQSYKDNYPNNNSMNGTIFENLIMIALARRGIDNIYYQTELSYVPSAIFDIFLYSSETPIAISIKTTLRERWKQADLEALAIKQVHKNAKCYVITLSHSEVRARRNNDNSYAGLDEFILADTIEFDNFLNEISNMNFNIAENIPIIKTSDRYYTRDNIQDMFLF